MPKNVIDQRLLRRVHSAELMGHYTLASLARINRVDFQDLQISLSNWRKAHGLHKSVSMEKFRAAADKAVADQPKPRKRWVTW